MNILIDQTEEIKKQLQNTKQLIDSKKLSQHLIKKIGIINDKLLDISNILEKLNINLKKNYDIKLDQNDLDYLENEKKSNQIISHLMPFLTVMTLNN